MELGIGGGAKCSVRRAWARRALFALGVLFNAQQLGQNSSWRTTMGLSAQPIFNVTVPDGVAEGQQFGVNTPSFSMLVTVPPGTKSGDAILVHEAAPAPITVVCGHCGKPSRVSPGATIVACPHCTAHNRVQGQEVVWFASVSDAVTYRQDLELVVALRASEASFLAAHADAGDADAVAEALAAEGRALPCYVLPSTGGDSSSQLAQTSWALRHGYATEC